MTCPTRARISWCASRTPPARAASRRSTRRGSCCAPARPRSCSRSCAPSSESRDGNEKGRLGALFLLPRPPRRGIARTGGRGACPDASRRGSAQQLGKLAGLAVPFGGIGKGFAAGGDHRPFLGQLRIQGDEAFLAGGDVVLGIDGLDRAFGLAQRAVDAL